MYPFDRLKLEQYRVQGKLHEHTSAQAYTVLELTGSEEHSGCQLRSPAL